MRIILVLLLFPCSLTALWVGENVTGGSLNPAGLINETILSRRLSFADTNSFLLSDAHLDLGGYLALYPVGSHLAARVKFSPLLFLDAGVLAGAHLCWKHYTFPEGTTTYGRDWRDGLADGVALIPYISPFWTLKLKFGPSSSTTPFIWKILFRQTLVLLVPRADGPDGWIFSWNSYLLLEVTPKLYLLLTATCRKVLIPATPASWPAGGSLAFPRSDTAWSSWPNTTSRGPLLRDQAQRRARDLLPVAVRPPMRTPFTRSCLSLSRPSYFWPLALAASSPPRTGSGNLLPVSLSARRSMSIPSRRLTGLHSAGSGQDQIRTVNGSAVTNHRQFLQRIRSMRAGDPLTCGIRRDDGSFRSPP